MNIDPDLIYESGREHLPLEDRVGLLRQDDLLLQANRPIYDPDADKKVEYAQSTGHQAHQFNQLRGMINGVIRDCDAKGDANTWGRSWLSKCECRILAWRRGGVTEYNRISRLQMRLKP